MKLKMKTISSVTKQLKFPLKNPTAATGCPKLAYSRLSQNRNGDKHS